MESASIPVLVKVECRAAAGFLGLPSAPSAVNTFYPAAILNYRRGCRGTDAESAAEDAMTEPAANGFFLSFLCAPLRLLCQLCGDP